MKKVLFGLIISTVLFSNLSSAKADPTYAVLDSNGNVTNIIICGSACESGTFNGNKVVLQVAADPVTNESRAGHWIGPGHTTYDSSTGLFTINDATPEIVTNSETIIDSNNNEITVTAKVYHNNGYQFKYEDTIGINGLTPDKINFFHNSNQTDALISVNNNETIESIFFENRKTNEEILEISENSGLFLLISQIQNLISLLGSWVK